MFIPKIYQINDVTVIEDFLKKNSFATLISTVEGRLWATHIPILLVKNENGENVLQGHVSKANAQWKEIAEQEEILVIFQGAHTFITADWYEKENVSTWNYMAAHVYGKASIVEGESLLKMLQHLSDAYESTESKSRLENLSTDYVRKELKGIYGIEINITKIELAFKLSQNRNETDYQNIINKLEERGDEDGKKIADAMKKV